MNEFDVLLDTLEDESYDGDIVELSSFEEEEAFEIENFLRKRGRSGNLRKMARRIAGNKGLGRAYKSARNKVGIHGLGRGTDMPVYNAQFDIVATRTGVNHAVDLPYFLFGAQLSESGYSGLIEVPAGLTLSVTFGIHDAKGLGMDFAYSGGGNTDIISVVCRQTPYPEFLSSLKTMKVKLDQLRMSISDTAQTDQFNREFNFVTRTMFGKKDENNVSVASFKSPKQFQDGIIDVEGSFGINKDMGIRSAIKAINGLAVTISCFVSAFGE